MRVDTGVTEGGEISIYYDPMIAKLITFGADRTEAIQHMRTALDSYYIRGVNHNIGFLSALIAHSRFQSGNITTNFIDEEYPDGFHPQDLPAEDPIIQVIVAASIHHAHQQRAASISGQVAGHGRQFDDTWVVVTKDGHHLVTVRRMTNGYSVIVDGTTHEFQTDWQPGEPLLRGNLVGNKNLVIQVERENIAYRLTHGGSQDDVLVLSPAHAELNALMPVKVPPDTSKLLLSPMPGLLISLAVAEGQEVKAGEELAVIEAMKMENVLRAERDAVVSSIKATTGESLMVDQVIMDFE